MLPKIIVYFALLATAVAFVTPQRAGAQLQPRHVVVSVAPVDIISASNLPLNNMVLAASESDFGGSGPASEIVILVRVCANSSSFACSPVSTGKTPVICCLQPLHPL